MDRREFVKLAGASGIVVVGGALVGCAGGASSPSASVASPESASSGNPSNDASPSSEVPMAAPSSQTASGHPQVFFTRDISPEGLAAVWTALGFRPEGKVAVKLSTGEPGGHNFLQPALIGDFVQSVGGTIVECNTAYGGERSTTELHLQAATDHGFTAIADVDIMDADGSASLPIANGKHLSEDLVGAHFLDYDTCISLAHFKGHAMGGFGGAIKNCSIGIASSEGKSLIHSSGTSTSGWSGDHDSFLESMGDAASAIMDHMAGRIAFVNVMNNLSVDCDCDPNPADPDMADIGILASLDPVAIDRACVDLVYAAPDGASVVERIESRNGMLTLDHAEALGVGSQDYELVDIDGA